MESMEGGDEGESENLTFDENEKPTTALNTQRGSNNNNNREPTMPLHVQNMINAPSSSLPGIEEEEVDRR